MLSQLSYIKYKEKIQKQQKKLKRQKLLAKFKKNIKS